MGGHLRRRNKQSHFRHNSTLSTRIQKISGVKKDSNGLITDHILTLFEDSSESIWVGSGGGGLFKWMPAQSGFTSFTPYVAGDIIYAINEDANKNIWIGTNRGLTKLSIMKNQVRSHFFLQENGLQGNIFNRGASFKDTEGISILVETGVLTSLNRWISALMILFHR